MHRPSVVVGVLVAAVVCVFHLSLAQDARAQEEPFAEMVDGPPVPPLPPPTPAASPPSDPSDGSNPSNPWFAPPRAPHPPSRRMAPRADHPHGPPPKVRGYHHHHHLRRWGQQHHHDILILRSMPDGGALTPRRAAPNAAPPTVMENADKNDSQRTSQEDRRTRGGLAVGGGATRFFGFVPLGADMMAGARLQAAAALGGDSSGFLSTATLGLSGGMDFGRNRGVDAQLWHAGLVLAVGAPWSSRDVFGIGIEGGLLGGSYYDGNPIAYQRQARTMVTGPYGESIGPRTYGLARVTLQVPLKGVVRPFLSGEFGGAHREDGRISGIAGVTGGVVWNAW